jgi:hypothetical protein
MEHRLQNNIQAVITNLKELVWTQEEIQKQMSEPQTNLFSNEGNFNSKRNPYRKPITTHIPPTFTSNLPKTLTIKPVPFKVQDLPEDLTLTSSPPKTLTIEPALPISPAVAIPTSAPILITPMVSAPAIAELTPPPTPKIAAALSPATCIPTEPQVQPQTLLTLCRNCQAIFTLRNRLHKHLRFDCFSITIKNAVNFITFTFTLTTSNQSFLTQ